MQFLSTQQEQVYGHVGKWLNELYGESGVIASKDIPDYMLRSGTTLIHVTVLPWQSADDSLVQVNSWVVRGPELTEDLMHFLLRENDDFRFGAFAIDKDGDINFEYNLQGSAATKASLRAAVEAVAGTADLYDEKIVAKWGGRRGRDLLSG